MRSRLMRQAPGVGRATSLIAVAASGTTPFTLACLREARSTRRLTIGIANNRGTPLLEEADHPIWLDTGAEPIAGSTRMKAGTAQRIALNLLSSLVMIRLGRVYEGPDGRRPGGQRRNCVAPQRDHAAAPDRAQPRRGARRAAAGADGSVKLAVLLLQGCNRDEASAVLDRAGGRLRTALKAIGRENSLAIDLANAPEIASPPMHDILIDD